MFAEMYQIPCQDLNQGPCALFNDICTMLACWSFLLRHKKEMCSCLWPNWDSQCIKKWRNSYQRDALVWLSIILLALLSKFVYTFRRNNTYVTLFVTLVMIERTKRTKCIILHYSVLSRENKGEWFGIIYLLGAIRRL